MLGRVATTAEAAAAAISVARKHSPLTGLFAINKPAGITSTTLLDHLQHVCKQRRQLLAQTSSLDPPAFSQDSKYESDLLKSRPVQQGDESLDTEGLQKQAELVKGVLALDGSKRAMRGLVKVGHGGTLDPLARGVVVIGVGSGCKRLHQMSGSSKVYIAEARLGYSSTTLDSTGSLVSEGPTAHVTRQEVLRAMDLFRGEIRQIPPLYSALNMDGKRLYDYAREKIPLPKEIPARIVSIYGLELLSFTKRRVGSKESDKEGDQSPPPPDASLAKLGFDMQRIEELSGEKAAVSSPISSKADLNFSSGFKPKKMKSSEMDPDDIPIPPIHFPSSSSSFTDSATTTKPEVIFHIKVHCSSGTYIRTLITDLASALGTVGHMTDLLRVEQSGFKLGGQATIEMRDCEDLVKVDEAIQAGNWIWEAREREAVESMEGSQ